MQLRDKLEAQSRLFRSLNMDPMLSGGKEMFLPSGEILFQQGADRVYFVLKGRLEVIRDETVLAWVEPGQCVGEVGILQSSLRKATIREVA